VKKGLIIMRTVTATHARNNLYKLIDETAKISEPIHISGKRTNAVLLSEDDWRDIEETLYLVSIPKMREKIIKGMKTPVDKCSNKLPW
jgi:antitoxin YefM